MTPERPSTTNPLFRVFDLQARGDEPAADAPVTKLCNGILQEALSKHSQSVQFIKESEDRASVKFERHGDWEEVFPYPSSMHRALVNRLKVMGNLHIDRQPLQQGTIHALMYGRALLINITVRRLGTNEEAVTLDLPAPGTW